MTTIERAFLLRDSAMARVSIKADQTMPGFSLRALSFLKVFAHKNSIFSAEDVTVAARAKGIEPHDMRAWGAIFREAAKQNYIERSGQCYMRRFGNGSPSRLWESRVYRA